MDYRCWHLLPALASLVFLAHIQPSHAAPAFKLKHFNFYNKPNKMSSNKLSSSANRVDRPLIGGSSPIHFINPFTQPQQTIINPFEQFFAPQLQMGAGRSPSNIYKLPLQMLANGKPHSVMRGLPKKQFMMAEYYPQVASNVIRLPLKYISNAKPIGVYFKDRASFNYI
ncbi:hypothetical protein JTE90_017886 [Oedothorax gibbosus]|uniref:Uncharacterized protein n=1 Tax=Oedothorax gibbosus TaxID=931172 RepID=A0AAV6V3F4_9ARAC|nr:hypothetical protein JTE90_017886 [Oedothorax gibbosus]